MYVHIRLYTLQCVHHKPMCSVALRIVAIFSQSRWKTIMIWDTILPDHTSIYPDWPFWHNSSERNSQNLTIRWYDEMWRAPLSNDTVRSNSMIITSSVITIENRRKFFDHQTSSRKIITPRKRWGFKRITLTTLRLRQQFQSLCNSWYMYWDRSIKVTCTLRNRIYTKPKFSS